MIKIYFRFNEKYNYFIKNFFINLLEEIKLHIYKFLVSL